MAAPADLRLSPEEYLAYEEASPMKHEYVRGEVYAMSGVSAAHNGIAVNLVTRIREHLRGSPCRVYMADVKVRVEAANAYFYPDLFVTCDPADRAEKLIQRHPKLIVEVLSDRTAAYDRTEKFDDYQRLDSLQEYLLIDSRQKQVILYRREADGDWRIHRPPTTGTLTLTSIDLSLPVAALYEEVEVPESLPRAAAPAETP